MPSLNKNTYLSILITFFLKKIISIFPLHNKLIVLLLLQDFIYIELPVGTNL